MPPLPPANIGAIVADVDMTIIKDASSELSGLNLDLITDVLSKKIHVLLISGSPYDSEYCGVKTSASLHRRVVLPLSQSLRRKIFLEN